MYAMKSVLKSSVLPNLNGFIRAKHTLPKLPYEYKDLEPIINRDIMELHHSKHHATYVNNLNIAEEKLKDAVCKGDVNTEIALQKAIKFNGGGHINHSIFWLNLSPCSTKPDSALLKQIEKDFCSMDEMKKRLTAASVNVQGSGWGWLAYNIKDKKLQIETCANQDPLQATTGLIPLFGIDVWEHAYYLQYKNIRADYVEAIFDIANWNDVNARFKYATGL